MRPSSLILSKGWLELDALQLERVVVNAHTTEWRRGSITR